MRLQGAQMMPYTQWRENHTTIQPLLTPLEETLFGGPLKIKISLQQQVVLPPIILQEG